MQLLCGLGWEFNCPSQPLHCISFLCACICMTHIYSLNFTAKKLSDFNLCLSQFGTQWGRLIQVIARVSNSFAFINYVAINCRPCLRVVVFILSLTETGCLPQAQLAGDQLVVVLFLLLCDWGLNHLFCSMLTRDLFIHYLLAILW